MTVEQMPIFITEGNKSKTIAQCSVCKGLGLGVEVGKGHNANTYRNKTAQTVLQGDHALRNAIH